MVTFVRPVTIGAAPSIATALGDVNNDGVIDLVSSYATLGGAGVWLGRADGSFGPSGGVRTGGILDRYSPGMIRLLDLDRGGNLDVLFPAGDGVSVALGSGDGTFGTVFANPLGINVTSLQGGDFNEDGTLASESVREVICDVPSGG